MRFILKGGGLVEVTCYATRLDPLPADPRVAHPPGPARERPMESAA